MKTENTTGTNVETSGLYCSSVIVGTMLGQRPIPTDVRNLDQNSLKNYFQDLSPVIVDAAYSIAQAWFVKVGEGFSSSSQTQPRLAAGNR